MTAKLLHLAVLTVSIMAACSPGVLAQCPADSITIEWTLIHDISGGDDIAWDIEAIDDEDGDEIRDDGFVVAGETFADDELKRQALIMRLTPEGTVEAPGWVITKGGNQNDVVYAVEQASNGNFIICGSTKTKNIGGQSSNNVWFFEVTLDGEIVPGSEQEYGGSGIDNAYDIKEDPFTGNYVIVGGSGDIANGDLSNHAASGINGTGEYWVLVIDPDNYEIVWENIYHGAYPDASSPAKDFARGILIDHEGNYLITGYCTSCGPDKTQMQAGILKLTNEGETIWQKNYGDQSSSDNFRDQGAHNVIEAFDENSNTYSYILTGVSHPHGCYGGNNHDCYILKLNPDGDNLWTGGCGIDEGLSYGGEKKDDGLKTVQTPDGGYLIAGDAASVSGDDFVTCNNSDEYTTDAWLIKLNADGEVEWDVSLGDVNNDVAYSIKSVADGSYVIAGEFGSASNGQDIYIVKFGFGSTESCLPPTGLNADLNGCEVTLTWDAGSPASAYLLRYKETSSSEFTTVFPATSPFLLEDSPAGSNKYKWGLVAICDGNIVTDPVPGPNFAVQACRIGDELNASFPAVGAISLSPNPAGENTRVIIELPAPSRQGVRIEITDPAGRLAASVELQSEEYLISRQLSVKDLPPGLYVVRVVTGDRVYKAKLAVQ